MIHIITDLSLVVETQKLVVSFTNRTEVDMNTMKQTPWSDAIPENSAKEIKGVPAEALNTAFNDASKVYDVSDSVDRNEFPLVHQRLAQDSTQVLNPNFFFSHPGSTLQKKISFLQKEYTSLLRKWGVSG